MMMMMTTTIAAATTMTGPPSSSSASASKKAPCRPCWPRRIRPPLAAVAVLPLLLALLAPLEAASAWVPTETAAVSMNRRHRPFSSPSPPPRATTSSGDGQLPPAQPDDEAEGVARYSQSRRNLLAGCVPSAAALVAGLGAASLSRPGEASAVVVDVPKSERVFEVGRPLGVEEAKLRFKAARESLKSLTSDYDAIVKAGGGDNIRRYLGTVGTSSGLYGIGKVLKELQDEAADVVEYTESMNDFTYSLNAADTAAYSSNFVEYSSAKGKPEDFYRDARRDIQNMKIHMDSMANELGM